MKKTIGIFAHVDAGKTTFSEQLLFNNGSVRVRGRVDDKNTVMDTDIIEQERGITVFSGLSYFEYGENRYYIIDTPGHGDFFPETRRAMPVIDAAIVLVSALDMVQSHTEHIWSNLKKYKIPSVIFINKLDISPYSVDEIIADMQSKLSEDIALYSSEEYMDRVSLADEEFMEKYLLSKSDSEDILSHSAGLFKDRKIFPAFAGSALKNDGIDEFFAVFDRISNFEIENSAAKKARVYKIVNDDRGGRISFAKILSGSFKVRDKLSFGEHAETINELRLYKGGKYENVSEVSAGDVCAIVGLRATGAGDIIGDSYESSEGDDEAVLYTRVEPRDNTHITRLMEAVKIMEDEEPSLRGVYSTELGEIHICTNGKIQLEILKEKLYTRFGIEADFGACSVIYKETIRGSAMGCGHFEPLKHYAEVHLELREAKRGEGISFKSELTTDSLPKDKQNLIEQYATEYKHRGILTGSTLTDVEIVLKAGAVHEKHTHGGDLLEAVKRAVRHGLHYGENVLLEPWYHYSISVPSEFTGRLMTDLSKLGAKSSPPETLGEYSEFKGLIPVSEAFFYFDELVLYTRGRARISAVSGGYDICHNADEIKKNIAYDELRDMDNPADSVFCSHGSGYIVPWREAREHMHLK